MEARANSYHSFSSVLHVPIVFSFPIFSVSLSQCCSLSVERWRGMEDGRKRSDLSVCQDWHQRERERLCVRACGCVCVRVGACVCVCIWCACKRERERKRWDGMGTKKLRYQLKSKTDKRRDVKIFLQSTKSPFSSLLIRYSRQHRRLVW